MFVSEGVSYSTCFTSCNWKFTFDSSFLELYEFAHFVICVKRIHIFWTEVIKYGGATKNK